MKLYAPKYYQKFQCIADRCEHSCCIGWEIDVDKDTLKKYKRLKSAYGAAIRDSICMDDTPHFRLGEGERCPHLDERGLCRIILNAGEDYLCDICREHPRFYNFTKDAEVGLGMSCPEAARLILSSPDYAVIEEIGKVDATEDDIPFDGRVLREALYALLQDESHGYAERLNSVYRTFSQDKIDDSHYLQILSSMEYLNPDHKDLLMKYSSAIRPDGKDEYLERFLAYLVYRHCTEALDEEDFCERLAFCLFCERLLASLICTEAAESLQQIATIASILSEEIEYSDENTLALTYPTDN